MPYTNIQFSDKTVLFQQINFQEFLENQNTETDAENLCKLMYNVNIPNFQEEIKILKLQVGAKSFSDLFINICR